MHSSEIKVDGLIKEIEAMAASAGISPGDFIPRLSEDVAKSADPVRAIVGYHRFLQAGFGTALLRDMHSHRILQQILLTLSGQSQYLTDVLVRSPELLHWLTATDELTSTKSRDAYVKEALRSVRQFERTEKKLNAIKRMQRRELLRIGAREILGEAPVSVTSGELSSLADAVVESIVEVAIGELRLRTGFSEPSTLAVIGMGKLGGQELNFSSDIDLLFVYDKDKDFRKPVERIYSNHEYYFRLSEMIVRMLSEHTEEGHLYRVDMRLRPDGNSGPLAMSRLSYLNYYESRGEMWERQMLMKARPIAGNIETGNRWLEDIRPFVFPKTFLRSPLDDIATIKGKIEERVDTEKNIKLGIGGIRDIEFIVQGLQMVWSGKEPSIRSRNTLASLKALAAKKFLSDREAGELSTAYEFFRTVEHRLQLLHGQQTHSLPESSEEIDLLGNKLGYEGGSHFASTLKSNREKVRKSFETLFHGNRNPVLTGESDTTYSKPEGVSVQEKQFQSVLTLVKQKALKENASVNISMIASSPHEAVRKLLDMSLEEKRSRTLLAQIVSRSSLLAGWIASNPLLFELILGQTDLMLSHGVQWMALADTVPLQFKRLNETRILLRFILQEASIEETLADFSNLARTMIDLAARRTFDSRSNVGILALGKVARMELTFGSDVDLVILHQERSQATVEKSARKFLEILQTEFEMEVDLRLRPEGKNAPLSVSLEMLSRYSIDRMALWERQALLGATIFFGDRRFSAIAIKTVHSILSLPLPENWIDQVVDMKARISREREKISRESIDLKVTEGGLIDMEFAVQAHQLKQSTSNKPGSCSTSMRQAISGLQSLSPAARKKHTDRWYAMRECELYHRINGERMDFILDLIGSDVERLASLTGSKSAVNFRSTIESWRRQNSQFFNLVIKTCRS